MFVPVSAVRVTLGSIASLVGCFLAPGSGTNTTLSVKPSGERIVIAVICRYIVHMLCYKCIYIMCASFGQKYLVLNWDISPQNSLYPLELCKGCLKLHVLVYHTKCYMLCMSGPVIGLKMYSLNGKGYVYFVWIQL